MKKITYLISATFIAASLSGCGAPSGKTAEESVPAQAKNTWLVNSLSDIETYLSAEPSNRATLSMLKNEVEHIQLVIATSSDDSLEIIRANAADGIDFNCRSLENFEKMSDVLVPCNGKVVPKNHLVKVWLTFRTGADSKAGKYDEVIKFRNADEEYAVAVSIDVADIAIPEVPTIPSVFGIHPAKFIQDGLDNEQKMAKHKTYSDFLLNYRISPYFFDWLPGSLKIECFSSPYSWNDYRSWEYLRDPRFNGIALPLHYLSDSELQAMVDKVRAEGLMDKSYFYIWDEPTLKKEYAEIQEMAARLHRYAPEAKVLITFFRGPKDGSPEEDLYYVFDSLDGAASIYCTGVWSLQCNEERSRKCREKLGEGQEWWCYVCMADTPGLAQNSTGVPNRVVMWRLWKEQASGFLYWSSNSFETMTPLTSPSNLPEGDGELVYPGEVYGSEVPCASIRLERWRDGAEDYELLTMHTKKFGREATEAVLAKVYTSPTEFTKDVDAVSQFKTELAAGMLE